RPGRVVGLPAYPWQRRRIWPDDLELPARGLASGRPTSTSAPLAPSAPAAESPAPRADAATPAPFIVAQLADLLLVDPRDVATDCPLRDLGMDSLMAQRLRNAIERRYGSAPSVAQLMRQGTVASLAAQVSAGRSAEPQVAVATRRAGPTEYPAS